jgi:ribose transport system substrate-binding protein
MTDTLVDAYTHARMRARRRHGLATGCLVLALAAVAGCGGGGAASGDPSTAAKTVGIVNFSQTSINANATAVETQKRAKAIGWKALLQDPNGEPAAANTICTQYVTQKVDAIVVQVFDSNAMAQCLAKAGAAKIPVFFLTSGLSPKMAGAVSADVPGPINERLVKDLAGNGKVLALTYNPGAPCRAREKDLDAQVAAATGITVDKHEFKIPGQVTDAKAATQAWLSAHPASGGAKLAVWGCYGDPGIGALAALKAAGRTDVSIYTWDVVKQLVTPLRDGAVAATLWLDPAAMAKQTMDLVAGYDPKGTPKVVDAAYQVIDKSTIDTLLTEHPDAAQ